MKPIYFFFLFVIFNLNSVFAQTKVLSLSDSGLAIVSKRSSSENNLWLVNLNAVGVKPTGLDVDVNGYHFPISNVELSDSGRYVYAEFSPYVNVGGDWFTGISKPNFSHLTALFIYDVGNKKWFAPTRLSQNKFPWTNHGPLIKTNRAGNFVLTTHSKGYWGADLAGCHVDAGLQTSNCLFILDLDNNTKRQIDFEKYESPEELSESGAWVLMKNKTASCKFCYIVKNTVEFPR